MLCYVVVMGCVVECGGGVLCLLWLCCVVVLSLLCCVVCFVLLCVGVFLFVVLIVVLVAWCLRGVACCIVRLLFYFVVLIFSFGLCCLVYRDVFADDYVCGLLWLYCLLLSFVPFRCVCWFCGLLCVVVL